MKTIGQAIVGAVVLLLASAVHSFAIEGIQVSVQSSNVVLSWPSATNETYIVQYLPALQSTNSWLTLTDGFPATLNTNLTVFVESNAVSPPVWLTNTSSGGTNSGGIPLPPGGTNSSGLYGLPTTGFYRVVRDGVHIFGLTNGEVLSGTIQQPIEFAVDATDEIIGVSFYDTNQNPVIGAHAMPGPGGGWILNWNTTQSANGNYAIEAELDLAGTNDPVVSVPVTVTVSNLFSFPNYLTQLYGSQMWIYAQTVPNALVELDMYDENTNYIGTFEPTSDGNGVISFIWNLTDPNGNLLSDTNFMGVWTVISSPSISQSSDVKTVNCVSPNFPLPTTKDALVKRAKAADASPAVGGLRPSVVVWINEPKWTPNDNWVVGVADMGTIVPDWFVFGGRSSPQEDLGVVGTLENIVGLSHIAPGINNNTSFNPIQLVDDTTSRSNLLAFLASQNPRYENFFWFGHGTEGSIQAIEPYTFITENQIAQALGNGIFASSGVNMYGYSQHPYRFVWCDGCNTAAGNLCEAFSIPAQVLSTNNFIAGGVMSRAFLGNKDIVYIDISPSDGMWQNHSIMYATFLSNMLENSTYSLAALVYYAQRLQGPFAQNSSFILDPSATSLGATDMVYVDPW